MSDSRCPRCGAARRAGDQWCGLCFADFREAPPPVVGDATPPPAVPAAPAQPTAAPGVTGPPLIRPPDQPGAAAPVVPAQTNRPPAASAPFVPSTNPLAPAAVVPTQLPAGVAPAAPTAEAAPADAGADVADSPEEGDPAADKKWPCPRCGLDVPMAEDYCPACGAGFLESARSGGSIRVPLLGDVRHATSGQKVMFGTVITVGILLVLVLLLTIGGALFT
ncbi:MAG TPA: hypothetical protein VHC43_07540 [Mycobacteriales bacterium]|nr:hypothetical protein [Mycobacteriales bacterium]